MTTVLTDSGRASTFLRLLKPELRLRMLRCFIPRRTETSKCGSADPSARRITNCTERCVEVWIGVRKEV